MSVFKNLYTDSFVEYDDKMKEQEDITSYVFFQNYMTTLINSFRWKGLPENMYLSIMEEFLQRSGCVAFFYDDDGTPKIFPAFPEGSLLENGLFSSYIIIAPNGKTWSRKIEDIELCFNNRSHLPYIGQVKFFADKTSNAVLAVDSSLMKALVPTVVSCGEESQLNTVSSLIDKIKNLKPIRAILRSKYDKSPIERVSAFDNRENDILALWDVYARYRNLYYTTFGINNVEITKRERLTEAEGKGNDEIVRYSIFDDMYSHRIDFIERVEKHFKYKMELEIRRDTTTVYELSVTNEKKIEDENILITRGSNIQEKESVDDEIDSAEQNRAD